MSDVTAGPAIGRVGPNAILQLDVALARLAGGRTRDRVFARAGLLHHLANPPGHMVDEADVSAAYAALHAELGADGASAAARLAGKLTGDYLLARRIPEAARRLLAALPKPLAARALALAIGKNAWTFVGSGRMRLKLGRRIAFVLERCPLARDVRAEHPACDAYAATFERLYEVLVDPAARVVETACASAGAGACVFEVRL